jgi:hypothetical protein
MTIAFVVLTTPLYQKTARFDPPGVSCDWRFNRRLDRRQCASEEPTGPIKRARHATGIARKRSAHTFIPTITWHLKVTARGAWASHPRAHQDHTHYEGRENFHFKVDFFCSLQ